MDCSLPDSSVHEIIHPRIPEWVAIPSSMGSSQHRDGTWVSCIAGRFFTIWPTGNLLLYQFSSVQSLSRVWLFATPWIAAHQASLSITNSWSSLRLTSIESVMSSSHLILWRPLLLLPPVPPSIRVFSNESTLHMRWPKYWSFRLSIIPSKEIPGLISFRMDWLDLLAVQGTLKSLLQHLLYRYTIICNAFSFQKFELFLVETIKKNVATSILEQLLLWINVSLLLSKYLGVELMSHGDVAY